MNLSRIASEQIEIIEKNSNFISFYIKNNFVLSKIIGEFDSHLKEIESLTLTSINLRGNLMIVRGDPNKRQLVVTILDNLIAKYLNTNNIENDKFIYYDLDKSIQKYTKFFLKKVTE